MSFKVNHNIFGLKINTFSYLEIPVNDFLLMQFFKGDNHLGHVEFGFFLKKSSLLEMKEHLATGVVFQE